MEEQEKSFTNNDAEQLYNSCVDMQRISFSLPMEIQLAKLITKLRNWTAPINEGKQKYAKSLGFIVNGNQYINDPEWKVEQQSEKIGLLSEEFDKVSKEKFEHWDELKEMLPLSHFTTDKFESGKYKFIEESQGRAAQNKQYFLEYCIKSD